MKPEKPDSLKGVITDKLRQSVGLNTRADTTRHLTDKEYRKAKETILQIKSERRISQRSAFNDEVLRYRQSIIDEATKLSDLPECTFSYDSGKQFTGKDGKRYLIRGSINYLQQLYTFALKNGGSPQVLDIITREIEVARENIIKQIINAIISKRGVNIPVKSQILIGSNLDAINQMITTQKVAQNADGTTEYILPIRSADELLDKLYRAVQTKQHEIHGLQVLLERELQALEFARDNTLNSPKYRAQKADSDYIKRK